MRALASQLFIFDVKNCMKGKCHRPTVNSVKINVIKTSKSLKRGELGHRKERWDS